jgi:hypothetical protein
MYDGISIPLAFACKSIFYLGLRCTSSLSRLAIVVHTLKAILRESKCDSKGGSLTSSFSISIAAHRSHPIETFGTAVLSGIGFPVYDKGFHKFADGGCKSLYLKISEAAHQLISFIIR